MDVERVHEDKSMEARVHLDHVPLSITPREPAPELTLEQVIVLRNIGCGGVHASGIWIGLFPLLREPAWLPCATFSVGNVLLFPKLMKAYPYIDVCVFKQHERF